MNNVGYKCGWVKIAALACVLAAAGVSWGQAGTLEEKATGSPAATEKYIPGRGCADAVDGGVRDGGGSEIAAATVLYVPADMPVPPELAAWREVPS